MSNKPPGLTSNQVFFNDRSMTIFTGTSSIHGFQWRFQHDDLIHKKLGDRELGTEKHPVIDHHHVLPEK